MRGRSGPRRRARVESRGDTAHSRRPARGRSDGPNSCRGDGEAQPKGDAGAKEESRPGGRDLPVSSQEAARRMACGMDDPCARWLRGAGSGQAPRSSHERRCPRKPQGTDRFDGWDSRVVHRREANRRAGQSAASRLLQKSGLRSFCLVEGGAKGSRGQPRSGRASLGARTGSSRRQVPDLTRKITP